ncbi:hypothetical protein TNCV_2034351 [Trichonephila clavipes]|nr:hypothetical protein TNCV_2034351 [Trichonephila clavipes]
MRKKRIGKGVFFKRKSFSVGYGFHRRPATLSPLRHGVNEALLITSWGILSHSSRRALSKSWRVCGGGWRPATRLPRASQTCSIGFMSGEHAGDSISYDSFLEKEILHQVRTMRPAVIIH